MSATAQVVGGFPQAFCVLCTPLLLCLVGSDLFVSGYLSCLNQTLSTDTAEQYIKTHRYYATSAFSTAVKAFLG